MCITKSTKYKLYEIVKEIEGYVIIKFNPLDIYMLIKKDRLPDNVTVKEVKAKKNIIQYKNLIETYWKIDSKYKQYKKEKVINIKYYIKYGKITRDVFDIYEDYNIELNTAYVKQIDIKKVRVKRKKPRLYKGDNLRVNKLIKEKIGLFYSEIEGKWIYLSKKAKNYAK